MTLQTIARDIERLGRNKLDQLGLVVVPIKAKFADVEDDEIQFHDKEGRIHGVSLSVSSLAPSWSTVNLSIQHCTLEAIPGTDFRSVSLGFSFPSLRSSGPGAKVAELLTAVRDHGDFVAVDDIVNDRIVTDSRFGMMIPMFLERFGGTAQFERTGEDRVDVVKLVDDDGSVTFSAKLGMGDIWITYDDEGEERKLHYPNISSFEAKFRSDVGMDVEARPTGPRR